MHQFQQTPNAERRTLNAELHSSAQFRTSAWNTRRAQLPDYSFPFAMARSGRLSGNLAVGRRDERIEVRAVTNHLHALVAVFFRRDWYRIRIINSRYAS